MSSGEAGLMSSGEAGLIYRGEAGPALRRPALIRAASQVCGQGNAAFRWRDMTRKGYAMMTRDRAVSGSQSG